MLLALLPALTLAAAETTTLDSQHELESTLTVSLRSMIASGWELVDVSHEGEGLAFTLTKGGTAERHVASFDGGRFEYRVEPAALPEEPRAPSAGLLAALRGRGGVEIQLDCGMAYERPYHAEGFAAGADARVLVARSLAAADDLEGAWVHAGRAVFQLETGGRTLDLVVTLGEGGEVAEAELRRFESRADTSSYRRRGALARALRRAFVSSIHDDGGGLVLRTSRGKFTIDPDGDAFRPHHTSEDEGCGC